MKWPAVHARCPECQRPVRLPDPDTDLFPSHRPLHTDEPFDICPGSGWYVETGDIWPGRWPRPTPHPSTQE